MEQKFIKLYTASAEPENAFFLNEGNVFFYITEVDKYSISGKNLIIGATEIIMTHMLKRKTERIETAVTNSNSVIKRMPVEKFLSGMNSFAFILNVSMVLAKQVLLSNIIINKSLSDLAGDEKINRELSIEYYKIVDHLKDEYEKRRLPWLSSISNKYETSLTFKRGEAFFKSSEPTKITTTKNLSDKLVEYPRGTIICEQGTTGNEMFILQSGTIDVITNGNKVATIEESGTVTGEMALFLGEKRTATLKASNNVVLTKITKQNLKEVAEKQIDLLIGVSNSLAKKHYYNIIKIESINKSITEQYLANESNTEEKKPPQSLRTKADLRNLKNEVKKVCNEKEADFLQVLIENF